MDINEVVRLYNLEKKSLEEIGKIFETSKSSVQRLLANEGYEYNKHCRKYFLKRNIGDNYNNVSRETIDMETNVSRETIDIVNRTYGIPKDIDKALKLKAVMEDKSVVDVVRELLRNSIDKKYFDM